MAEQTYSNKGKIITNIHGEERFDLKAFVAKILNHWPLFLGSVVVFMGIFMVYKRYNKRYLLCRILLPVCGCNGLNTPYK
ncbi:hypothetical protein [Mucilaginibacter sp.]|uniref:hypothetical protein n=1 Tax=Mucilaginibacter sp. TaxID=1882438 RepID=UPI0025F6288F|nr:hypothetical protein [Mucilaginibacter sp.]